MGKVQVNHWYGVGHLAQEPLLKEIKGRDRGVCEMCVAVQRKPYKDEHRGADFLDVTVWGQLGEHCHRYLSKGSQVIIEGELRQRSWRDANNEWRKRFWIVAHRVSFLGTIVEESDADADAELAADDKMPF